MNKIDLQREDGGLVGAIKSFPARVVCGSEYDFTLIEVPVKKGEPKQLRIQGKFGFQKGAKHVPLNPDFIFTVAEEKNFGGSHLLCFDPESSMLFMDPVVEGE